MPCPTCGTNECAAEKLALSESSAHAARAKAIDDAVSRLHGIRDEYGDGGMDAPIFEALSRAIHAIVCLKDVHG